MKAILRLFTITIFVFFSLLLLSLSQQVWAACGYEDIETSGTFNVETCDVACEDDLAGECAELPDPILCKDAGGSTDDPDCPTGLYCNPGVGGSKTSVCFEGGEQRGCINGTVCETKCVDDKPGIYTDTARVWVCDELPPEVPVVGGGAGGGDDGGGGEESGPICGDASCNGFETCEVCPDD